MVNEHLDDRSLLVLGEDGTDVTSSAISAPMILKGRMIGAISAQSYNTEAYSEDDLAMLQGIADLSAVAINNAQQFAELRQRRRDADSSGIPSLPAAPEGTPSLDTGASEVKRRAG